MVNITSRKVALWTASAILVILGFYFLWLIRDVLFLVFLSILLATGIEPVVNWLRRGPFTRSTGILVVYTFIMAVIAAIIYFTVPPLIDEGNRVIATFTNPDSARQAISGIKNSFVRDLVNQAYQTFSDLSHNFKLNTETLTIGFTVLEVLFSSISVFVIAFYWLTERTMFKRFVFSFFPEDKRPYARTLWTNIEKKLGSWTRGQLVLMAFIGVLMGIGYTVMGLKYAFALAVFAGLTELIPLVGPYIGGAPAVLLALTQDPLLAVAVAAYIVVIQLIEGNILVPRIMNSAVGVTPLTVIIGILIGSALMGIGGALLAVPIAAAIQVSINTIRDNSDDPLLQENDKITPSQNGHHEKQSLPEISGKAQ
jgi:predicted PurR-regulated permease PerM